MDVVEMEKRYGRLRMSGRSPTSFGRSRDVPLLGARRASRSVRIALATLAAVMLKLILDVVYVHYVDAYHRASFAAGVLPRWELTSLGLIESYALTFICAFFLVSSAYRRPRPSGIILVTYFAVVMLPLFTLYGLAMAPEPFVYAAAGSFLLVLITNELLPRVRVARPGHGLLAIAGLTTAAISLYVYGVLMSTGGIGRLSFDLLGVYEVRSAFVQIGAPFMGYLVPWQATVVNIAMLCYAVHRRRLWLAAVPLVAQILIYGMTGHRAFLISPVLAIGVYVLWQRRNNLLLVFTAASAMILGAYLLFGMTDNHVLPSLLIRRLFFVPAGNHLIYYDFFSQPGHPYVALSNSILSSFVQYPYELPLTRVISWTYWGSDFAPNVGYLGDAYAHFGIVGMFAFSVVLGVFLRILDSVAGRVPAHLAAAIAAVPGMALVNSALLTSFLTHGMIPALFLIFVLGALAHAGTCEPRSQAARLAVVRYVVPLSVSDSPKRERD